MTQNSVSKKNCFNPFHGQDFNGIRNWCIQQRIYFEDPYFKLDLNRNGVEWKRPGELVPNPKLFVDGPCRFDVLQGQIGDCWMLAAIATLAMNQKLVKVVVPTDQSFSVNYAGIFHFRFWRFGKWCDVVIDDRLPTVRGQLILTHSATKNEFWSALLEKAYCKVIGDSYSAADEGNLSEAFEDFTGGVVEEYQLRLVQQDFQQLFLRAVEKHSLIGCFIDNLPGTIQSVTPNGLVRGHSYSVTDAKLVPIPNYGNIFLVRVRNPWGKFEWNGPWCDGSPQWDSVPDKIKRKLNLVQQEDGEFWMSYQDFISNFEWVEMCHLDPDVFSNAYRGQSKGSVAWQCTIFRDQWVSGVTAGGSRALHMNPQMRFTLKQADADNALGQCSVLIALIQKTNKRGAEGYHEIGYKIYRVNDHTYDHVVLDKRFFSTNQSVDQVPVKRSREVAKRFSLKPGAYCVVPFTNEARSEGEFIVRIFSEKRTELYQVESSVRLSEEKSSAIQVPVDDSTREGDFKKIEILKEYFEKISKGGTNEIGWKGLKDMLDFAMENDKTTSSGVGGFFLNIASFLYRKIFHEPTEQTKNAFDTIGPKGFPIDISRSIIAYLDVNHSGQIGFEQFLLIWKEIKNCKSLYEKHTEVNQTCLSSKQLKAALEAAGFRLNNRILKDLVHQYATEDGEIPFDEFMCCTLKLKTMSEIFWSKEKKGVRVEFTLEEFLEQTLYS